MVNRKIGSILSPNKSFPRLLCLFFAMLCLLTSKRLSAQQILMESFGDNFVEVCAEPAMFGLTYYNFTNDTFQQQLLSVTLPTGIAFVAGSTSGQNGTIVQPHVSATLQKPVFELGDLIPGDSASFQFQLVGKPEAVAAHLSGLIFRNECELTYNGNQSFQYLSPSYNLFYPAISIVNITPTQQNLTVGAVASRSITMVNAGNGKTSALKLTDLRNKVGLDWIAASIGTLSASGDTLTLTAADFASIGNGDGYFDTNESITITQTFLASGCNAHTISSAISTHWGCSGSLRSSSILNAHIQTQLKIPSLKLTPTASDQLCMGDGSPAQHSILIENKGDGLAAELLLEIYKSTGGGYNQNILSSIDPSTISYQIENGPIISINPVQTSNTRNDGIYSCLGTSPIGKVVLSLPSIDPDSSLTVYFETISCCANGCEKVGNTGWRTKVRYEDFCQTNSYQKTVSGQDPTNIGMSLFTETYPDIDEGEKLPFTYTISSFENNMPTGSGAYYELVFDIPEGLSWSGDVADLTFASGNNSWTASSVSFNASSATLSARYPLPIPFSMEKSEITLQLTGDCSPFNYGVHALDLSLDINFVADTSCVNPCVVSMICDEVVSVDLHCPSPGGCPGLNMMSTKLRRVNVGQADNNQDGKPDSNGTVDFSKIKLNRLTVGDTLEAEMTGWVGTNALHPNWAYGAISNKIEKGNLFEALYARVAVFDQTNGQWISCDSVPIQTTSLGTDKRFEVDFSPQVLSNLCSDFSGYLFESGDTVEVKMYYTVRGNLAGGIEELDFENEHFYLTNVANPSLSDRFQCDDYDSRFTLIGYFFGNANKQNITVTTCSKVVSQNFYFSMGDCCDNYAGGNLFPFEYRNWAFLENARVSIPPHYEVVNAYVRQKRTKATNSLATQTINPIAVDSQSGDTLFFDIAQYYQQNGGSFLLSDDGFNGTLYIELAPSCDVPENIWQEVDWAFQFQKVAQLGGGKTEWITHAPDRLRYRPATLSLSSPAPILDGLEKTVSWEVEIKNTSSNGADHAWFHIPLAQPNLTLISVIDMDSNQPLNLEGDIYKLGELKAGKSRNLQIRASYHTCSTEKLEVFTGYECSGYPTSFSAFSCGYSNMELSVSPQPAEIQTNLAGITEGGICGDEVEIQLEIASVKLAIADSIYVRIEPSAPSLSFQSNSSALQYPLSNDYQAVNNPILVNGSWEFQLADMDSSLGSRGLPGVLDLANNRLNLKFKMDMGEDFKPGDYVKVTIGGQEACGNPLPEINLAYDPSVKFRRNVTAGLSDDQSNSWSVNWIDYNHDGLEDVFIPDYDPNTGNFLYKNNGDGTFSKVLAGGIVTDKEGAVSSSWADYDNDGYPDVLITGNIGSSNQLFRNNGDGSFTEMFVEGLTDYHGYIHSASWADYDNDGWLDLFLADYMPTKFDLLFHNNGDGTFSKVVEGPVVKYAGYTLGAVWADYDNDGLQDLFVPESRLGTNKLYHNEGNGQFSAVTTGPVVTDSSNSAGGSWGDYDNDGDLDLYVTNASMQKNYLYQNNGDGTFTSIKGILPVSEAGHWHGSSLGDIDNDGDLDLVVVQDQAGGNRLYINDGAGNFSLPDNQLSKDSGKSFGVAMGDADQDGDLDILIANHSGETNFYYENETGACNNWACFNLTGTLSNSSAIGAKVRVKATINGEVVWQMREISAQSGAGGQNSLTVRFGLGNATFMDSVIIDWPSGTRQYLSNEIANNCVDITEQSGTLIKGQVYYDANQNCVKDTNEIGIAHRKIEILPGPRYVTTDFEGKYQLYVEDGTYELNLMDKAGWLTTCNANASNPVSVQSGQAPIIMNFPTEPSCNNPDLEVNLATTALRRGFQNTLVLSVENTAATAATNVQLSLELPAYIIPVEAAQLWDQVTPTSAGYQYQWNLGTLAPQEQLSIQLLDSVGLDAVIGDSAFMEISVQLDETDCNLSNNQFSLMEEIVGSVDPNDILVFPRGMGPEGLISPDDTLTYKIRFQNVGTAEASFVFIADTLPSYLDLSSIQLGPTSHPFEITVSEEGIINWKSIGIQLPDSTEDEAGSHGFVQFSILPLQNLPIGTQIRNQAAITFDFNEPIITNQVLNTLTDDFTLSRRSSPQLALYPNPSQTYTQIRVETPEDYQSPIKLASIQVFDAKGNRMWVEDFEEKKVYTMDVKNWPKGVYMIHAIDAFGYSYSEKLLVY